jgi:hypothetical protein
MVAMAVLMTRHRYTIVIGRVGLDVRQVDWLTAGRVIDRPDPGQHSGIASSEVLDTTEREGNVVPSGLDDRSRSVALYPPGMLAFVQVR